MGVANSMNSQRATQLRPTKTSGKRALLSIRPCWFVHPPSDPLPSANRRQSDSAAPTPFAYHPGQAEYQRAEGYLRTGNRLDGRAGDARVGAESSTSMCGLRGEHNVLPNL